MYSRKKTYDNIIASSSIASRVIESGSSTFRALRQQRISRLSNTTMMRWVIATFGDFDGSLLRTPQLRYVTARQQQHNPLVVRSNRTSARLSISFLFG
jgi:hypothetical protein